MVAGPIAQYVQDQGPHEVGAIIADYAWGQAIRPRSRTRSADLEGVELQIEVAPVPEKDFTTYLRNLEAFGPELIVATGHPPGSGADHRAVGRPRPRRPGHRGVLAVGARSCPAPADAAIGRYSDFDCADYESEGTRTSPAATWRCRTTTFMEDDAVAGYGIVTMVAEAVAEVGDDPAAIAEYLHGQTFDLPGYAFEVGWTEWGELATAQPLFASSARVRRRRASTRRATGTRRR